MNVTCPNCATVYRVDPAKVPETGVRARCAVCSAVFAVAREPRRAPAAEVLVSAAPASPAPPPPPAPAPAAAAPPPPAPVPPPRPAFVPPAAPASVGSAAPRPSVTPPAGGPAYAPPRPAAPPPTQRGAAPPPPAAPVSTSSAPAAPPRPPASAPAPAARQAPAAGPGGRPANPFLSQDPTAKARRLARALVSDIVVYHPAKRQEGIRDGNLKELFEEEIKKSWEEYTEQVGREVAESTGYFREALNEILAGGRQVF